MESGIWYVAIVRAGSPSVIAPAILEYADENTGVAWEPKFQPWVPIKVMAD
jgi:hypothetical protein